MFKLRKGQLLYYSFFVFILSIAPFSVMWIMAGFGLVSYDASGAAFFLNLPLLPITLPAFAVAVISSLIGLINGPSQHRIRVVILWACLLIPYSMAYVPPPALASLIGTLGLGLGLSITWGIQGKAK